MAVEILGIEPNKKVEMAISSRYRWVAVGSLHIRNRMNAAQNAPQFYLSDLIAALESRISQGSNMRLYDNEQRAIWCSLINETENFYEFLMQTGDKDIQGVSFFHFASKQLRDIEKDDDEGGLHSSHVLIRKEPDKQGRHTALVEKVPGVNLGTLRDYFCWTCNDAAFVKEAPGPDGKPRKYRALFEVDGYQSRTLGDALGEGVLADLHFVSSEDNHVEGHDEDPVIEEVIREAKWRIGKRVTEEQAKGLFAKAKAFFPTFVDNVEDAQIFVRIKTGNGQIKRTQLDVERAEILEQAFVQNEVITGFEKVLPPRYTEFHAEVLQKLHEVGEAI